MSLLFCFIRWLGSPARLTILMLWASCTALQAQDVIQCSTIIPVTPTLRGESYADLAGDIVLLCQGGTVLTVGAQVPAVNITLSFNTAVTSRTNANGWSEALLLIDEPGSGESGATNTQLACNDPNAICNVSSTGGTLATYDGSSGRPNIFPGQVNGNSVTFLSIPIDPPGPAGVIVLRFTNVRVNANALSAGPNAAPVPLVASITLGDNTVITTSDPSPTVGFVQNGLSFGVRTPDNSALSSGVTTQCGGVQRVGVLRFGETVGTAFVTRTSSVFVDSNTSPAPVVQNIPGTVWNSESGFYAPSLTAPTVDFSTVGLADAGTRFRASISNIPSGVGVFVSATGVTFANGNPVAATTGSVARLTRNEATSFAALDPTTSLEGVPAVQLQVTNGSAVAVWEVLASDSTTQENFDFVVWIQAGASSPGTAVINGSLAPAPPTFSAAAGSAASSTLPVPRFIQDPNSAQALFTATVCAAVSVSTPVLKSGTPVYGNPLKFSATATSSASTPPTSDTISFFDGSTNIGTANIDSSGTATITTSSPLSAGAHSITAQFNGDANFGAAVSGALLQSIGKATTSATVSPVAVGSGQSVAIGTATGVTANLTSVGSPPTGTVNLTDSTGTPTCQATLTAGAATCSLTFVASGSHTIVVNYAGDTNYSSGVIGTLTIQVAKATSTTSLLATPNPSVTGRNVTLTATVNTGTAPANGTVRFTNGGITIVGCAAVPVSGSTAQCVTSFSTEGVLNLAAVYSGDAVTGASSGGFAELIQAQGSTSMNLTASQNPATVGQAVSLIATVNASSTLGGGPRGGVKFYDGSTLLATVALTNGQAGTRTTFSTAGSHTIFATYSGDSSNPEASAVFGLLVLRAASSVAMVSNPNATVFGQAVTLTAQLVTGATGVPAPTGQIQFFDGLTALGSADAASPTITIGNFLVGMHQLTAVYSGDNSWSASRSAAVTQMVSKAPTAITVTASSAAGSATVQSTVTAVAAGVGTPGGGILFMDAGNNAILATATLTAGIANATVGAGGRMIVAVYSGDANFLGSTSAPVLQLSIGSAASLAWSSFAPNEMVTLMGANLAGSTVSITGSTGPAQKATPSSVSTGQINFAMPRILPSGPATVTVTSQSGSTTSIAITIASLAPGIFTVSPNGKGTAQAVVLDVGPYATSTLNGANPISLNATDKFYLELFGTGFDNAKKVTVTINGQTVPVMYSGSQPGSLDQVNVGPLPASLKGAGTVNVQVTADGVPANIVTLTFQ